MKRSRRDSMISVFRGGVLQGRRTAATLCLFSAVIIFAAGCQKISLSPKTGGGGGGSQTAASNAGPGNSSDHAVDGDWTLSFVYNDNQYDSTVTLSQKGKALAGEGKDNASGKPFMIKEGKIDNGQIHFVKQYQDMDPGHSPVTYNGTLEYENDADYHGWRMGGHYTTTVGGKGLEDKWVAVPAAVTQGDQTAVVPQDPGAQTQPGQDPGPGGDQGQPQAPAGDPGPPAGGEQVAASKGHGPNISGQWSSTYQYDFKKTTSQFWLEQDGGHVTGHGVDKNTNEKYVIEKGWYSYPKITLKCKYTKGKNAAESRVLTIQAKVDQHMAMNGETQFGGSWHAQLNR